MSDQDFWYLKNEKGDVEGPFSTRLMVEQYNFARISAETLITNNHIPAWISFKNSALVSHVLLSGSDKNNKKFENLISSKVQTSKGERILYSDLSDFELQRIKNQKLLFFNIVFFVSTLTLVVLAFYYPVSRINFVYIVAAMSLPLLLLRARVANSIRVKQKAALIEKHALEVKHSLDKMEREKEQRTKRESLAREKEINKIKRKRIMEERQALETQKKLDAEKLRKRRAEEERERQSLEIERKLKAEREEKLREEKEKKRRRENLFARTSRDMGEGACLIYIIHDPSPDCCPVKVGITYDLDRRIREHCKDTNFKYQEYKKIWMENRDQAKLLEKETLKVLHKKGLKRFGKEFFMTSAKAMEKDLVSVYLKLRRSNLVV